MTLKTTRHGQVVLATLDRPDVHNALDRGLLTALEDCILDAERDGMRCLVVTGAGEKAFSAGADLQELRGMSIDEAKAAIALGQRVMRTVAQSSVPVIAAVNGLALGGGFELALASTFPVLGERARLGLPESSLGLIPGYGGTQRLTRAVGPQVAAHLMITGARMDASRAYQLGLTPVPPVPDGDLATDALAIAQLVAGQGPHAVRAIRTAAAAALDVPLQAGLDLEAGLAAMAIAGQEAGEGVSAFLEKRPAAFRNVDEEEAK